MKFLVGLTILFTMGVTAIAQDTDIFGDGRNVAVYFSDSVATFDVGCTPIDGLDWGLRVKTNYDSDLDGKVEEWTAGPFVRYPSLDFESFVGLFPMKGNFFADAALLFDDHFDAYFVPGIGIETTLREKLSGMIKLEYSKKDEIFGDPRELKFSFGFIGRW